jgi:hypothetical protein
MAIETCPFHNLIQDQVTKQSERPCDVHTTKIAALEKEDSRLDSDNQRQWTEINKLKFLVYSGVGAAGVLSFLGSLLGAFIKK